MLFEAFDFGLEARSMQLVAGLLLGLAFGAAAQITRFCLRRAVAGEGGERASAAAVWVTALAVAFLAFATSQSFGLVSLADHRLQSTSLPIAAILIGGVAFGIGMVLTRGCVSRLTVLSATGNLRAVLVLAVFALTAHATLKGVLAPVRTGLGSLTIELPWGSFGEIAYALPALAAIVILFATALVISARPNLVHLILGATIGLVAVGGWVSTSYLLFDEFDPLPVQSAAFTSPWSDSLFWVIASSAIPAGFGVGFIGGVLGGSFASAALRGEIRLQSFTSPSETLRYLAGGMLMGVGGVLAGGCTVGAGLSGSASGSIAALLALIAIIIGGYATASFQREPNRGYFAT